MVAAPFGCNPSSVQRDLEGRDCVRSTRERARQSSLAALPRAAPPSFHLPLPAAPGQEANQAGFLYLLHHRETRGLEAVLSVSGSVEFRPLFLLGPGVGASVLVMGN